MDEPDAGERFFLFDVSNVQIVVLCSVQESHSRQMEECVAVAASREGAANVHISWSDTAVKSSGQFCLPQLIHSNGEPAEVIASKEDASDTLQLEWELRRWYHRRPWENRTALFHRCRNSQDGWIRMHKLIWPEKDEPGTFEQIV